MFCGGGCLGFSGFLGVGLGVSFFFVCVRGGVSVFVWAGSLGLVFVVGGGLRCSV